jgi:Bacterial SH3 domain
MSISHKLYKPISATLLLLAGTAFTASCSGSAAPEETAYVVPANLKLRSSTAPVSKIVGELKSGDRITIVGRSYSEDGKLWTKIKTPNVDEGWAEARYFVKDKVVEESRRIAETYKGTQTQAIGRSKASLKLRLTPDRSDDNNVATLLAEGTVLEVVGRERKPKPITLVVEAEGQPGANKTGAAAYDDWLLVRLKDTAVLPAGWIYGGSVELDIPADIIYLFSSGRRIIGWQKLGTVKEENGKSGDHYLVLERTISNADEHVDFDRVKVLAYDPVSREYTTPFRDDVSGRLPINLRMEGTRGRLTVPVIDKNNESKVVTYDVEVLDDGKVKVIRTGDGKS